MSIVKTVKHGNCTWKYDDEFCRDVTPEQAQERINAVSRIIMNALRRKEAERGAERLCKGEAGRGEKNV